MRATEITEAMGVFKRLGQQVASKFGSPMAKGRLEADDMARHMINLYNQYLGTSKEKATRDGLLMWLRSKRYPTKKAKLVVPAVPNTTSPATQPAVNTNIPAYQRKGIAPPLTTPKPAGSPPATTALKFPRKTVTTEAAPVPLNPKQVNDMLTAAASEFVSSGYKLVSPTTGKNKPAAGAPATSAGAVATQPQAGAGAFGQMAGQLKTMAPPAASSTGGTTKQTATGQVHTANPSNPNKSSTASMTPNVTKVISLFNSMSTAEQDYFKSLLPKP